VLRIFSDRPFKERTSLRRAFEPKEALPKVCASIDVLRVAFKRGAITGFGFIKFALLEIDVAELKVMMSVIQVMNLGFEFLDATAFMGARQFKTASGRNRTTIVIKVIPNGAETAKNEEDPKPFALPDGID